MMINLYAAWTAFLLGCAAGAVPGLFFRSEHWLGGYGSWERRMIRLAHIAFFGLGALNLGFFLTANSLGIREGLGMVSALLLVGLITMPLVCYLSAAKGFFRHLFAVPATAVTLGIALFLWRLLTL